MSEQLYHLAFVFPGQGSQSVGMLQAMADAYPEIRQTFEQASEILGKDLWQLVQNGPEEELNQTRNTQPIMLTAGVALWQLWCQKSSVRPAWMAGHSLGEYTALVCADAIPFASALKLVAERGRLMQEAIPIGQGAMAAVLGLEDYEVVRICSEVAGNDIVSAVNFNSPGQVVIAGHTAAVERALTAAKDAGAKRAILLPVSVPSHCLLMCEAAERLYQQLQKIHIDKPKVTLVHNVDVSSHSASEVIRNALKEQLYQPVRWSDTIRFMHDQGVTYFVECGPGKVLLGLNKRIVKNAQHFAIYDPNTFNELMERLHG
jgi:[acyl-carrier-protein] S-malonyltransferase